jgi:hypothetical protein
MTMLKEITAEQARQYIKEFQQYTFHGVEYVDFASGRIYLNNMTDEQAIKVCYGLMDIEEQAAKGVRKQ